MSQGIERKILTRTIVRIPSVSLSLSFRNPRHKGRFGPGTNIVLAARFYDASGSGCHASQS